MNTYQIDYETADGDEVRQWIAAKTWHEAADQAMIGSPGDMFEPVDIRRITIFNQGPVK